MTATPSSARCSAGDAPCNPSRRLLLIATAGAGGALAVGADVAVLPCCHERATCDLGALDGWVAEGLDVSVAIDVTRVARLIAPADQKVVARVRATHERQDAQLATRLAGTAVALGGAALLIVDSACDHCDHADVAPGDVLAILWFALTGGASGA